MTNAKVATKTNAKVATKTNAKVATKTEEKAKQATQKRSALADAAETEFISANPDIVLDALDAIGADEATLGYDGYGKPFSIRSEADGYEGILMPLRCE